MAKKAGSSSAKKVDTELSLVDSAKQPGEPTVPRLPTITQIGDVIGQPSAIGVLRSAMTSGRVHHAWIFSGPPGVGKRTAAVAFASTLLDPTVAPDLTGALVAEAGSFTQAMIRAGSHPDLHIITKELAAVSSDDKVRQGKQIAIAKKVIVEFLLAPAARTRVVQSGTKIGKVFIVDEAELLNDESQNTLLKTLEEPPSGTVLILVTTNEDRLLTTIRSRCQRVEFGPLSDAEMQEWFRSASRAGLPFSPEQVPWLMQFASGSPGSAMLAIEHGLFEWHNQLEPLLQAADKGAFSPELGSVFAKLVEERAAAAVKANRDASKDAANKAWSRRMLSFLAERVRLRMRAYLINRRSVSDGAQDPVVDRCLQMLGAIEECERHIGANVSIALVFENLSAQMIAEPQPLY